MARRKLSTENMNITHTELPRQAAPEDFASVIRLLKASDLPVSDLSPDLSHFFVIEMDGKIIASAGLEVYEHFGLLRSVVVDKNYRNRNLATTLLDTLISYAAVQRIETLYLITTTAEHYFARKGFQKVNREKVPEAIAASTEFSTTCPSTATVMVKEL